MMQSTNINIELDPGQAEGVEVIEGDPQPRRRTLFERSDAEGHISVALFECQPARTRFRLSHHQVVHVLRGEVEITLGDGSRIALAPGDVTVLPKGHDSEWWFKSPFRELAIVIS